MFNYISLNVTVTACDESFTFLHNCNELPVFYLEVFVVADMTSLLFGP